ncbi:MAG TPA: phosphomannomutase/phosphoglucomutase [Stellaceae bacterium]
MTDTGHRFDPTILREYDIRGIVGETLHEADAYALGRAYAKILTDSGGDTVAVGRDGRLSSPALEAALVDGLVASGVGVARIGLGPTPMLYYAGHTLGVDGALMVTGSHNPANHNGFKLMLGRRSMYGDDIKQLGHIAARGDFVTGTGKVESRPVRDAYINRLLADFRPGKELTVAWDAGNGATGDVLQRLVARLPGRHILLNETIDGTFPAHHPDPTEPENLLQLQEAVSKNKCDLGIAFDGDGDRIGVVDGDGHILWGDQLLVVLAQEVIAAKPGAQIIADVKASQILFDEIARIGGKPIMWRTGHSLIKSKMAETGAPLAGEMSGHIFYADRYYGYDDALYAAIRLLNILARSEQSLADMRRQLPVVVNTPELRIPCADTRKFAVIDEVKARLTQAGATVSDIDGVRVSADGGWWLLRASNTQAVLVARVEARDAAGLDRLTAQLAAQLSDSGVTLPARS